MCAASAESTFEQLMISDEVDEDDYGLELYSVGVRFAKKCGVLTASYRIRDYCDD